MVLPKRIWREREHISDQMELLAAEIPLAEQGDIMGAYYRRLTGTNEEEK